MAQVRAQPYVALDQEYLRKENFDKLSSSAAQISRMISGLMKYLRQSGIKGTKFKKFDS